jgi:hypothetical protein
VVMTARPLGPITAAPPRSGKSRDLDSVAVHTLASIFRSRVCWPEVFDWLIFTCGRAGCPAVEPDLQVPQALEPLLPGRRGCFRLVSR